MKRFFRTQWRIVEETSPDLFFTPEFSYPWWSFWMTNFVTFPSLEEARRYVEYEILLASKDAGHKVHSIVP